MNEAEANTKWCPFNYASMQFNVETKQISERLAGDWPFCIGSACMMWRTSGQGKKNGYCGLGGKVGAK